MDSIGNLFVNHLLLLLQEKKEEKNLLIKNLDKTKFRKELCT